MSDTWLITVDSATIWPQFIWPNNRIVAQKLPGPGLVLGPWLICWLHTYLKGNVLICFVQLHILLLLTIPLKDRGITGLHLYSEFVFYYQFTTSEAIQSSKSSEKLSSSPATDVVVTGHPSGLTYLRQIFDQDQVSPQGQIVSVLPHGITSPLSPTLPELHQCKWDNCCEHFLSLEDLVAHVNEYHIRTEASEYSCLWQGCPRNGKGFNARYKMLIHMRTHTGERPHTCTHDSCGKSFSRLENLKIHTRSHTGEKPYACPVAGCNKRYSNSSDRYKHTRTHSETKPYHCKVPNCFKRYTDPSSLRKHYKTIHGKDLITEEHEWS